MKQPLFPSTIGTQSRFAYFLTIKAVVKKFGKSDGQTWSRCLDKAVLAQKGGGGLRANTYLPTHTCQHILADTYLLTHTCRHILADTSLPLFILSTSPRHQVPHWAGEQQSPM